MKITHEHIKQLVDLHPNDSNLGRAIRDLVSKDQNTNEIQVDPNQYNLLDSINEVKTK
jgi:hypothetical protein